MMRKSLSLFFVPLLLAGCHPPDSYRDAFASGTPPVLDSVSPKADGTVEFRFHAKDGNVVALHREVPDSQTRAPADTSIDIESAQQKSGGVFSDRWACQGQKGRQTIRAYLIDGNHHHSNSVEFSADCSAQ